MIDWNRVGDVGIGQKVWVGATVKAYIPLHFGRDIDEHAIVYRQTSGMGTRYFIPEDVVVIAGKTAYKASVVEIVRLPENGNPVIINAAGTLVLCVVRLNAVHCFINWEEK